MSVVIENMRQFQSLLLLTTVSGTLLTGCVFSPLQAEGSGQLKFQLEWPKARGFQLLVLPEETQTVQLVLQANSGERVSESLSRSEATSKRSFKLSSGQWRLSVSAKSGSGLLLAEAQKDIVIRPNQVTQTEIELIPSPQPTPTASTPAVVDGNGPNPTNPTGPQSPPTTPASPASGDPNNPNSPPSNPDSPPASPTASSPAPSASSSPSSSSSGGGGGGGSGGGGSGSGSASTAVSPEVTALSASPTSLSGLGFSTELTATLNDPNNLVTAAHISWSCADTNNVTGCGSFSLGGDFKKAVWTAPLTSNGGAGNVDTYALKMTVNTGSHPITTQIVNVSVRYGTGSASINNGQFDGGL
jgi:hypothetical protein